MRIGFVGAGNMAGAMARGWAGADRSPEAMLFYDVDAEKAKIPDKLPQMSIGNKTSDFCELQPIFCERSNSACADWINLDTRFAVNNAGKIHWHTIDDNQIDFGVRDSTGFDHVLDRSFLG